MLKNHCFKLLGKPLLHAKESLLQAARKAPVAALGFRIQCNKWAIIVRLLLGEIPERTFLCRKAWRMLCGHTSSLQMLCELEILSCLRMLRRNSQQHTTRTEPTT